MAPEQAEDARARMLELFPEGVEEREEDRGVEVVGYVVAGREERFRRAFPGGRVDEVEQGWTERWKRFHRPARVGPLWIGPPWEAPDEGAVAVVIDPGLAFGTGAHATTRLCIELLLEREPTSLADLGCGSGVVAIAAAKLGFGPVFALDADEDAVETARRNAAANAVRIDVRRGDVLADPLPATAVAVANITLREVERVAPRLRSRALVASGYLVARQPSLPGWAHRRRREAEGWAADVFERE